MDWDIPIYWSFKHSVGTEGIDKQTPWKRIWRSYQDNTNIKHHENYSITFSTSNFVVYRGITFGAGIGIGTRVTIGTVMAKLLQILQW